MISDKIRQIMKEKNIRVNELANYMGVKPQSVTNKFSRDSWSTQDFISVMDFMDCEVIVRYKPDVELKLTMDDIKKR